MKESWSRISGIIENNEKPIDRAMIEIYEEIGIKKTKLHFLKVKKE